MAPGIFPLKLFSPKKILTIHQLLHVTPYQLQGVSVCSQSVWFVQFAPSVLVYNATSASHSACGISVTLVQSKVSTCCSDWDNAVTCCTGPRKVLNTNIRTVTQRRIIL